MNDAGNLAMLGRVIGGLVVVLVLIGLAARVARRARGQSGSTGLRVIDRIGLTREANLTVIEVANRVLLLGVTAQGVTMLADLDAEPGTAAGTALDDFDPDGSASAPEPQASPEPNDLDQEHAQRAVQAARAQTLANAERGSVKDRGFAEADRVVPETHQFAPEADRVVPEAELRSQRRPVPTGVALEEYPDLASALRAAGRTSGSAYSATTSGRMAATATEPNRVAPETSGPGPTAPRTRAEARAEARARSAAAAQLSAQTPDQLFTQPPAQTAAPIPTHTSAQAAAPASAQAAAQTSAQAAAEAVAQASAQDWARDSAWDSAQAAAVAALIRPAQTSPSPLLPAGPRSSTSTELDRIPAQRQAGGKKRVVPQPTEQASGSVLSPRTWRQGIEALRDLTVRRG
ncbi:MAG TPA: flagellar biosynthetic protein FliO [Kineosporiaceae bacterium]|nr:flagellar biosynthetic protein FliO [Kineosporiaceae bacterium]